MLQGAATYLHASGIHRQANLRAPGAVSLQSTQEGCTPSSGMHGTVRLVACFLNVCCSRLAHTLRRLRHVQHNADGSPKYKEVGPEMFCHEPKTGKVGIDLVRMRACCTRCCHGCALCASGQTARGRVNGSHRSCRWSTMGSAGHCPKSAKVIVPKCGSLVSAFLSSSWRVWVV